MMRFFKECGLTEDYILLAARTLDPVAFSQAQNKESLVFSKRAEIAKLLCIELADIEPPVPDNSYTVEVDLIEQEAMQVLQEHHSNLYPLSPSIDAYDAASMIHKAASGLHISPDEYLLQLFPADSTAVALESLYEQVAPMSPLVTKVFCDTAYLPFRLAVHTGLAVYELLESPPMQVPEVSGLDSIDDVQDSYLSSSLYSVLDKDKADAVVSRCKARQRGLSYCKRIFPIICRMACGVEASERDYAVTDELTLF